MQEGPRTGLENVASRIWTYKAHFSHISHCYTTVPFKVPNWPSICSEIYSNNIDAHFMWPLKQTVKRLIKGGSFLQAGLNNATVYFQPGIRNFSPARNPTSTGRVCFTFMILGLFQRVVISLLVAGGKGGTVPALGALGRGQMERKAAPEEATCWSFVQTALINLFHP